MHESSLKVGLSALLGSFAAVPNPIAQQLHEVGNTARPMPG